MTEPVGDENPVVDNTAELATLREQLSTANERINKYDGERKDYKEQKNSLDALTQELNELKDKVQSDADEDAKYLSVTQEELKSYKDGEAGRFADYTKAEAAKQTQKQADYQKYLGEASLSVKDEELFTAICAEHDGLVSGGGMPDTTGNIKTDAQLAWKEAENSYYRKQLSAGKTIQFEADPLKAAKPVVPGTKQVSTPVTSKSTKMPDLPEDARAFLDAMGDSDNTEFVAKAFA